MIVRLIEEKDIPQIMDIENASFSVPWSENSFRDELVNSVAIYLVAEVNEKVVAYIGMWKVFDEGHITNVAVLPSYRGKGIGQTVVNRLFDVAKENDITRLTLEVRRSNSNAIKLYEKSGFVNCGIRPNYYTEPKEDAIIMWCELK